MRAVSLIAVLACGFACQPSVPELPWLYGLDAARGTDRQEPGPSRDDCPGADAQLELGADVAGAPPNETIVASYTGGVVVRDREGVEIAAMPGLPCTGSVHELVALAAGNAYGRPTIAIAGIDGGHHLQHTWVAVLHATPDGGFAPAFTGVVEATAGDEVQRGWIFLLPDALVYQRPGGRMALWRFDETAGAYVFDRVLDQGSEDAPAAHAMQRVHP
ncbi:MAG: hypothetical protein KF773_30940 [Deltaproteobacteria bacterium]|nr:hypothetical protein [Deltaproteobacteria bacterium]